MTRSFPFGCDSEAAVPMKSKRLVCSRALSGMYARCSGARICRFLPSVFAHVHRRAVLSYLHTQSEYTLRAGLAPGRTAGFGFRKFRIKDWTSRKEGRGEELRSVETSETASLQPDTHVLSARFAQRVGTTTEKVQPSSLVHSLRLETNRESKIGRGSMLTGELRNKIDRIWDAFWAGGIANPLEVIEQITYLLFIRGLDDVHTREENKANRITSADGPGHLPRGQGRTRPRLPGDARSRFRNKAPAERFTIISRNVFLSSGPWRMLTPPMRRT